MFKVWKILTWGGGTPFYLVSASTKERAWELVREEWGKLNISYDVGGDYYERNGNKHQTIDDLKEVPFFYSDKEYIIDLYKI
jgi:hypothetical protein